MQFVKKSYSSLVAKHGKTRVILGLILLSAVLIYTGVSLMGKDEAAEEAAPIANTARTVSLYTITGADDGTAVPTADGTTFVVRAESGGRVERIAKIGDTVARGAIVAQVENSAQRAAVLQAQGAYEAARAGARASDVGADAANRAYDEALTQAVNAYRSAFATTDNVLRRTVDQVFAQPDSPTPGVKIDARGQAITLNQARIALEQDFDAWQRDLAQADRRDARTLLTEAERTTTALNTLVITLTSLLSEDDAISNATTLASLRTDFATARGTLTGVLSTLSGARSALIAAESAKDQAAIAGTRGDVSLADAQVKQALGVLESARAALAKTAIKTPIAGTVTAASISVGDIITPGSDVVFVASSEITDATRTDSVTVPLTAVKFTPSKAFVFTVVDDTLVAHEVKTGSVTTKHITITGADGINEIVLDVRGLKDGDTVVTQ